MFEYIKTKRAATIFFILAPLIALMFAGVRIFVVPDYQNKSTDACLNVPEGTPKSVIRWCEVVQFANDVSVELSASVIELVLITVLLLLLLPRRESEGVVEIWGHEIAESLKEAVRNSRGNYWFRGRSGRWLRYHVLPQAPTNTTVKVHILDPRNEAACLSYVNYRNKLRLPSKDGEWTVKRLQIELITTIVSCYAWSSGSTKKIQVFLSPTFSLFRLDMSGSMAILTREDPLMPALRIPGGSYLYDSFVTDFDLSEVQAEKLPEVSTEAIERTTATSIKKLLDQLKIVHNLSSDDLNHVVQKVQKPESPYG